MILPNKIHLIYVSINEILLHYSQNYKFNVKDGRKPSFFTYLLIFPYLYYISPLPFLKILVPSSLATRCIKYSYIPPIILFFLPSFSTDTSPSSTITMFQGD